MFGGAAYGSANDPGVAALASLNKFSKIEVDEKALWNEKMLDMLGSDFQMAQKYNVFGVDQKENLEEIFFVAESTGCCTRQLKKSCPDCAPWNADIFHVELGGTRRTKVFEIRRPWTCTCLCFNRPKVDVTNVATGQLIGSIVDPWACWDITFTLKDADGNDQVYADGGCCQAGLICPLPCGPCSRVQFPLARSDGTSIGIITKKVPSCCAYCFNSEVDNYRIDVNEDTPATQKLLIMVMSIFMDFRYFNVEAEQTVDKNT